MNDSASAASQLVAALRLGGYTVATAESLTAGLLAATIADVPGASAVLRGGLIVYATDLKHTLARVDPQLLADWGPVSEPTAVALARGARDVCGADIGVALTGVAGPDEVDGNPVGTVYIAVATGAGGTVRRYLLHGSRAQIRAGSCTAAIDQILSCLADEPPQPGAAAASASGPSDTAAGSTSGPLDAAASSASGPLDAAAGSASGLLDAPAGSASGLLDAPAGSASDYCAGHGTFSGTPHVDREKQG